MRPSFFNLIHYLFAKKIVFIVDFLKVALKPKMLFVFLALFHTSIFSQIIGLKNESAIQNIVVYDRGKILYGYPLWGNRLNLINEAENQFNTKINPLALIKFSSNNRMYIENDQELAFQSKDLIQKDGWQKSGSKFKWSGSFQRQSSLALPLMPIGNKYPIILGMYDSVWVDLKKPRGKEECNLSLQLSGVSTDPFGNARGEWTGKTLGSKGVFTNEYYPDNISVTRSVNISDEHWKYGSYLYYFKKFLGLTPDESEWNLFSENGSHSLRQRTHLKADSLKYIDLVYRDDKIAIDEISLYITRGDNFRGGKKIIIKPDFLTGKVGDKSIARFNVELALKDQKDFSKSQFTNERGGGRDIFLQELRIKFSHGASNEDLIGNHPPIKLNFIEEPNAIPSSQFSPTQLIDRVVMDLRDVNKSRDSATNRGIDISQIMAILTPKPGDSYCDINIEAIRLARIKEGLVPKYATPLIDWGFHLGGPSFPSDNLNPGLIEYSNVSQYLPISSIIGSLQEGSWRGNFYPTKLFKSADGIETVSFENYNKVGDKYVGEKIIASNSDGATIRSRKNVFNKFDPLLLHSGDFDQLEIYWPIDSKNLPKKSKIFIGGGNGSAGEERAKLYFEGINKTTALDVRLNQQTEIPDNLGYIKSILIVPEKASSQGSFNLKDVAIFTTQIVNFNEALNKKYPSLVIDGPHEIRRAKLIDWKKDNLVYDMALTDELRSVYGLSINYEMDLKGGGGSKCIAKIIYDWEEGETSNYFCPSSKINRLDLGIGLTGNNSSNNLGRLKSIKWLFNKSELQKVSLDSLKINFDIIGWENKQINKSLLHSSIFSLNGNNYSVRPSSTGIAEYSTDLYPFARLKVEPSSSGLKSDVDPQNIENRIIPSSEDFYTLERVEMETELPVDLQGWREFFNQPQHNPDHKINPNKNYFWYLFFVFILISTTFLFYFYKTYIKILSSYFLSVKNFIRNNKSLKIIKKNSDWYAILFSLIIVAILYFLPNFKYESEIINASISDIFWIVIASNSIHIISNSSCTRGIFSSNHLFKKYTNNYLYLGGLFLFLAIFSSLFSMAHIGQESHTTLLFTRLFYFSTLIGLFKSIMMSNNE